MPFAVKLTPEAEKQLDVLYDYIADEATPVTADRYVNALLDHCRSLATFPRRAPARDDIRPGLRVTHYKGRTLIPYDIDEDARIIWIHGFYYGGQDFESDLSGG